MAHKKIISFSDGSNGEVYVNDISVGLSGNNRRRADVQLVQFFLSQFYNKYPELSAKVCAENQNRFVIDGFCGKHTCVGIAVYQYYMRSKGTAIEYDGTVNIPNSASQVTSVSHTFYTILNLNVWFRKYGDGTEYIHSLQNHPQMQKCAPELRAELAVS